ncbi:hypothetical protein CGLO_11514 [Colletotrichum gloeosporioides Cg-14]|uniref:Uncharacterized protein n=1 Tax=Colletotrichum gloeosporioides (strain Cg-14) TaxID=1237896 RepID=T0LLM0_COLGC|nr:hypothetical protein CGLO_11514 [Colletotrichum gloeosporioides Cg-14]
MLLIQVRRYLIYFPVYFSIMVIIKLIYFPACSMVMAAKYGHNIRMAFHHLVEDEVANRASVAAH